MSSSDKTLLRLDYEKIGHLYDNSLYGLLGNSIAIVFVVLFLWTIVAHRILLIWLLGFVFVTSGRLLLVNFFHRYNRQGAITPKNIAQWGRWYYYGFTISGAFWASTIFFPFNNNPLLSLAFIALVLIGLSSSAIAIYCTSLKLILTYLTMTMIPLAIRLFSFHQHQYVLLGFLSAFYYLMMLQIIKILNKTVISNIQLKLENEQTSLYDPLTGLANRRLLHIFGQKLTPRTARQHSVFSALMADIDDFKIYNDQSGHDQGDQLIVEIARSIQNCIRQEDLAVRYGGDEFLVIFPDTTLTATRHVADRIRQTIAAKMPITLSCGIAAYGQDLSLDDVIRRADMALLQAKRNGKDSLLEWSPTTTHLVTPYVGANRSSLRPSRRGHLAG